MYLIVKDHKAGTVRVEEVTDEYFFNMAGRKTTEITGYTNYAAAAETAKSIAIKENLVYTPVTEL